MSKVLRAVQTSDGRVTFFTVSQCPHFINIMDFGQRGCTHPDSTLGCVIDFDTRPPKHCPAEIVKVPNA